MSGTETIASLPAYNTHTSIGESQYTLSCTSGGNSSSQCDTLTETTFNWPSDDPFSMSYTGTSSYVDLEESISSILEVAALETEIVVDSITTRVTLDGLTTTIVVSTNTIVRLDMPATTITVEPTAYTLTVPEESRGSDSSYSETTTISATEIYLNVAGVSTTISLEGISTEFTQITTLTLEIPESTSFFVSAGMVSSYVTTISDTGSSENSSSEESTSDTNVSSSEESI